MLHSRRANLMYAGRPETMSFAATGSICAMWSGLPSSWMSRRECTRSATVVLVAIMGLAWAFSRSGAPRHDRQSCGQSHPRPNRRPPRRWFSLWRKSHLQFPPRITVRPVRPKLPAKTSVSEPAMDDIFQFHRRTSKALPRAVKIFVRPVKQEYLQETRSMARHRTMESLMPPCPMRFATERNWLRDAPAMARM